MALRISLDVDGPVVLVDTIDDYRFAIQIYDIPILVPPQLVEPLGLRTVPDDPLLIADALGEPLPGDAREFGP